jgi:epoxyqueuosine reductase
MFAASSQRDRGAAGAGPVRVHVGNATRNFAVGSRSAGAIVGVAAPAQDGGVSRESEILELAREIGFDLAGIAPLRPPKDATRFAEWLDSGHHASMEYLRRNQQRIEDPRRILPEGRSILVVGLAHSRAAVEVPGGGRVARYAAGRDYHNVMRRMLRKLRARLRDAGVVGRDRLIVDAGPLLERSHAAECGVGFESKAANLLHPRFGPWFFLGELLLSCELTPTDSPPAGSCGTCTACIDACPTQAIVEPGRVDARRCISYLTIENRGIVAPELRSQVGGWAFGCDVCSEVCPWAHRAGDFAQRFGTSSAIAEHGLVEWLDAGEKLTEVVAGSPLRRPGRAGLARNAAIALGNVPSDAGRHALLRALSFDPAPLVREAAAWSLARAHGDDSGVSGALGRAARTETEPEWKARLETWARLAGERPSESHSR